MFKQLFSSIFSKEAYQAPQKVPTFTLTDNGLKNNDCELAEMSFKEFTKLTHEERRKNSGASLHNTLQEAGVVEERRKIAVKSK